MLPIRVKLDLDAMAIKEYFTFPKPLALLEHRHQIVYCSIQNTGWGSLTPLQRCSRFILLLQPIGPRNVYLFNETLNDQNSKFVKNDLFNESWLSSFCIALLSESLFCTINFTKDFHCYLKLNNCLQSNDMTNRNKNLRPWIINIIRYYVIDTLPGC